VFSLVRFGQPESVHAVGSMISTTYARIKGNVYFVRYVLLAFEFFRKRQIASKDALTIQGQQQHLSKLHHDMLLSRYERGLKLGRGVRCNMKSVLALPFVDGAFTHAVAQRQGCSSLRAGRHLRSDGGRSACVFVQVNHHDKAPGWTAVVTQRLSISCRYKNCLAIWGECHCSGLTSMMAPDKVAKYECQI